jgi:protein-S-isoprenylcysteine O-methyltransferase Ste14
MLTALYHAALLVVAGIALARSVLVLLAFIRTLLRRKTTVAMKWGWVEIAVVPEPIVLGLVTYRLYAESPVTTTSLPLLAGAIAGAILAMGGGLLGFWTLRTLSSMGAGHYILKDQPIVDRGPFGLARHPVYLCAFLIWLALPVAYASLTAFAVFAAYVLPVYGLYAREEEKLLVEHYGDEYRDYRQRVGMFFPRLRRVVPEA